MHPKQLLDQHRLSPKKSLGQNFLFDENVLQRIVDAAALTDADTVLEIGPGLGHLTRLLAETAVHVVAVELDQRFWPILQQQLMEYPNVTLIHGNILDQDLDALMAGPYKVVANVPYYITGAILRHLLDGAHKPTSVTLTVQQEVAERLTAVPPHMSLLAVSVQYFGAPTLVTTIKAGAFWPAPDVDSAVVRIDLYPERPLPAAADAAFFRLVKAGFNQKRKQLQKNLRQLGWEKTAVRRMLAATDIDGRRRAETLSISEWIQLYQATTKETP